MSTTVVQRDLHSGGDTHNGNGAVKQSEQKQDSTKSSTQSVKSDNENKTSNQSQDPAESHNNLECSGASVKQLDTQIAGHKEGFLDVGDGYILKALQKPPRGPRELGFYETVFDSSCQNPDLIELRPFLAPFGGSVVLEQAKHVKLKNMTSQYRHPCVADIKMGRVTYDQDAPLAKRERETNKWPPMAKLGYRICGMMVHDPAAGTSKSYSNDPFCLSITEKDMLTNGLGRFYGLQNGNMRHDIIRLHVHRLRQLEAWFLKQKSYSFIASSLLLTYEGSGSGDDQKSSANKNSAVAPRAKHKVDDDPIFGTIQEPAAKQLKLSSPQAKSDSSPSMCILPAVDESVNGNSDNKTGACDVRLIDFAHAFPTTETDENFLFGLRNLLQALEQLLDY